MIDELEKQAGEDERYKNCPNCSFGLFINNDAKEFYCEKCDKAICPDCEEPPHPEITCEQYLEWKRENDKGDALFDAMMKLEGMKNCPHCQTATLKVSGCNFMTCRGPVCRGKRYFCYLCGCILTKQEHWNHFKRNNPYNDQCINML